MKGHRLPSRNSSKVDFLPLICAWPTVAETVTAHCLVYRPLPLHFPPSFAIRLVTVNWSGCGRGVDVVYLSIPFFPYLGDLGDDMFQRATCRGWPPESPQTTMWARKKTLLHYATEIPGPSSYCVTAAPYCMLLTYELMPLTVKPLHSLHIFTGLPMGQLLFLRKQQNGALAQVCYSDPLLSLKCNILKVFSQKVLPTFPLPLVESRGDHFPEDDRDT